MKRKPKLEIYKAKDGWRWRLRARNGQTVATSAEAYVEKRRCRHGFYAALQAANEANEATP